MSCSSPGDPHALGAGAETDEDAAGQTEEEDEPAVAGAGTLFDGSLDPLSLLEGMALHQEDDAASQQPFEVLASSKRRAKQALASATAAGGQVCGARLMPQQEPHNLEIMHTHAAV